MPRGNGKDSTSVTWRDKNLNSMLHLAANAGHVSGVHSLVQDEKMDVNSSNILNETPLHSAIAVKDKGVGLQIIQYLLDHGANPYVKDECNDTFLHLYVMQFEGPTPSQFHLMVECLVERNLADLFSFPGGSNGASPLQLAVGYLEPEETTLSLLHSHGINVNFTDNDGDCLLAYAVYGLRSVTFLSYIINMLGADLNHINGKGTGLLQIAAYSGSAAALKYLVSLVPTLKQNPSWNALLHLSVDPESDQIDVIDKCRFLIGKGANKNSKTDKLKQTALHLAAIGSRLEVIQWLILNGANPYSKDKYDFTFLHHYFWGEETSTPSQFHLLAEYLIGMGFYRLFNTPGGEDRSTPVQQALFKLEVEERTLALLSSNKVNFKILDKKGDSILVYAVTGKRSVKLLSILIEEFKVKWRLHNKHRNSILHFAAEHSNFESLKFFLDMGSLDVNGVDGDGDTPLHCAIHQQDKKELLKKCKSLIEMGADVNIVNKEGNTPLDIMRWKYDGDDKEQLEKLLSHNWHSDNGKKTVKARRNATTHLKPRNK